MAGNSAQVLQYCNISHSISCMFYELVRHRADGRQSCRRSICLDARRLVTFYRAISSKLHPRHLTTQSICSKSIVSMCSSSLPLAVPPPHTQTCRDTSNFIIVRLPIAGRPLREKTLQCRPDSIRCGAPVAAHSKSIQSRATQWSV